MRINGGMPRGRDLGSTEPIHGYRVSRFCAGIPRLPTANHVPSGHGDCQSHTSTMQVSHGVDPPLLRPFAMPPDTIHGPLPQEKACVVL
jgi:hypothetical protein